VRDALVKANPKKTIRKIRLPIEAPIEPTPYRRHHVGLPEGYVFLFTFDFNSVMKRKNPLGAIEAYCSAFGPNEGAHLVLKSINGHHNRQALGELKYAIQNRPDISLHDGYLSSAEVQAQLELSDCFVSLHRSEGYGLNLASAMAVGTPVITTGYSGNLEFMPDDYPFLVDFAMTEVGGDAHPYSPCAVWAEPNLDTASELMRKTFEDRVWSERNATIHRERLLETFSIQRCIDELHSVLEDVE
jgi:glycosyltransferase involved in cell wall biosynthesis